MLKIASTETPEEKRKRALQFALRLECLRIQRVLERLITEGGLCNEF